MLFPKLDTVLLGNSYAAIELFSSEGGDEIALLLVERKKNELKIVHQEKRGSFEQLTQKPEKGIPVLLVINNNQVIQKEVDGNDASDPKILSKAFSNLKQDDFYYEIFRGHSKSIVAICRKNYIEDIQAKYQEHGIAFSGISLGVCSISALLSFTDNTVLKTNTQQITANDASQILNANENDLVQTFDINGLEVQNTYLLPFALLLSAILKNNMNSGSINLHNSYLRDNYYQKSFFSKGIKAMVLFLLLILLLNFLVFSHYFEKANETSAIIDSNKGNIENLTEIKNRLASKIAKINAISTSNSESSLVISEIVNVLPNTILLNDLTLYPLEKKIKPDEAITTEKNVILVSGRTSDTAAFTSWIEKLEAYNWANAVIIKSFGKNENKETVFTIRIEIKPQ